MPGLASYGAPPPVRLEGDYARWTLMWKRSYAGYYGAPFPNQLCISEDLDLLILPDGRSSTIEVLRLSDGTILSETVLLITEFYSHSQIISSVLVKYLAVVWREAGVPKLQIYKDSRLVQTIDLSATLGWTSTGYVYTTVFSRDGKYLFVSNTDAREYALFKGG
jgi:hypothetical protein